MKLKYHIALSVIVTAFGLAPLVMVGCQSVTDPSGKTSRQLTPQSKAVLAASGDVLAQALAQAAVIEASGAAQQYVTTGKVDQSKLTADIASGIAGNLQGYIGEVMTAKQLATVTGVPAIASTAPASSTVTQTTVDTLESVGAVQSVPK